MLYINYFILAFLVVYISIYLSKYVDELDKKTNISGAFIGGVLLAAVTSLPEFMTSLTSVFILNEPNLVQGNVLGSNIFNLTILSICILIFPKKFKASYLSSSHIWTSIITIIMFLICFSGMKWDYGIHIGFFNVDIASLLIILLYFINIKLIKNDESTNTKEKPTTNLTVRQILIRFVILSILLVFVSIMLTNVTDKLNEKLNLGATVGGAIFLGIATSLPELTSSINLARLSNFDASFGNVIGSNLFNFTILSISDIFYSKGEIFSETAQADNIIFWGIVSTILAISLFYTKKSKNLSLLISLLILISYSLSIIFSL